VAVVAVSATAVENVAVTPKFKTHNTTCMANLREYGSCSRYSQRNLGFADKEGVPPIAEFSVWCDCLCHIQDDEEDTKKNQRIEESKERRLEAQKQLVQDSISRLEKYNNLFVWEDIFRLERLASACRKAQQASRWDKADPRRNCSSCNHERSGCMLHDSDEWLAEHCSFCGTEYTLTEGCHLCENCGNTAG